MLELMYSKYDLRELLLAIKITRFYICITLHKNAYIIFRPVFWKKKTTSLFIFFFDPPLQMVFFLKLVSSHLIRLHSRKHDVCYKIVLWKYEY